jgi:hypothetical protein
MAVVSRAMMLTSATILVTMLLTTATFVHEVSGDGIKVIVGYEMMMGGDEDESSFEM